MSKNFDYQGVANTVASNLTNRQNASALGQFLNVALETYKKHVLDDQANQSLAVADAPKATAVTDASGNPIIDDTGATTRPEEAAYNADLGYNFTPGTPPDRGGVAGLKLRQLMMDDQTNLALKKARIAKLLAPPAVRTTNPLDDVLKQARIDRIKAGLTGGGTGASAAMTPNALAVQKRFDARTAYQQHVQDLKDQDDWYKTNTGLGVKSWGNWTNPKLVNEAGEQDQNGAYFDADAPDGKGGTKHIHIPRQVYEQGQQRIQQVTQPVAAPAASTTSSVATGGDLLTQARQAIAAGADPDKVKDRLEAQGVDSSQL